MNCVFSFSHRSKVVGRLFGMAVVLALWTVSLWAQGVVSITDGTSIPEGIQPGVPDGTYVWTQFEDVNYFNGQLNIKIPLLDIRGRGEVGYTMRAPVTRPSWIVESIALGCWMPWCTDTVWASYPSDTWWRFLEPGYGPGVVEGRRLARNPLTGCGSDVIYFSESFSYIVFTGPDGTEIPLYDQIGPLYYTCSTVDNRTRGNRFVTRDGSEITFLSDANVQDDNWIDSYGGGVNYFLPNGYLAFSDGTRYRVEGGKVTWMRDRNGNRMSFTYDGSSRVTKITDSLNREVTVTYNFQDVSPYREVARVVLPTGGAVEFDHGAGLTNGLTSGQIGTDPYPFPSAPPTISVYRRLTERRVYENGSTLEGRATYSRPESSGCVDVGHVQVEHLNASSQRLFRGRHFSNGKPACKLSFGPTGDNGVQNLEGREHKTELFDTNGTTLLRRIENNWQLVTPGSGIPLRARLLDVKTTLDGNLVSRLVYGYDQYENRTLVEEYAYGSGAPGSLLRKRVTTYVTTNNGVDYATTDQIHLKRLPAEELVQNGSGTTQARTLFEYDRYSGTNNAALLARPSISQLSTGTSTPFDPNFTQTSYTARGNLTRHRRYVTSSSSVSDYLHYDVAGNRVKALDPRNFATEYRYDDNFGAPNGEARTNTPPRSWARSRASPCRRA